MAGIVIFHQIVTTRRDCPIAFAGSRNKNASNKLRLEISCKNGVLEAETGGSVIMHSAPYSSAIQIGIGPVVRNRAVEGFCGAEKVVDTTPVLAGVVPAHRTVGQRQCA